MHVHVVVEFYPLTAFLIQCLKQVEMIMVFENFSPSL